MKVKNRPTLIVSKEEYHALDTLCTCLYDLRLEDDFFNSIFKGACVIVNDFEDITNILCTITAHCEINEDE